jgi:hypothetical protein
MTKGFRAAMTAIAGALTVWACGPSIVYDYVPPESPEGRMCANQCVNNRDNCRQMARMMDQNCQNNQRMAQQSYNSCRQAGGTNCVSPPICYSSGMSHCDEGYRSCFTNCGGRVVERPAAR